MKLLRWQNRAKSKKAVPKMGLLIRISFLSLLLASVLALVKFVLPGIQTNLHAVGSKPNIVFILTDDQTFESLNQMPYLSSRPDWLVFDNAFENTSLCCPSRASILSGQYDTHTGVLDNSGVNNGQKLDERNTLPVWLQRAGYTTALVGKYLNEYPWDRGNYIPPGWNQWMAFTNPPGPGYYNYTLNENGTLHNYGSAASEYSTDVLASKAASFVATASPPFFLYFAPHAPHSPFIPPPKYNEVYARTPVIHDPSFNEADVSDKPAFIRRLAPLPASIQDANRRLQWEMGLSVDDAIKQLDTTLSTRGLLASTVEVFMTDNGYADGEHRWMAKRCEYDVCMHTPLLIRYPGQPARHITALVQNIDLAATFTQLAGVTPGRPQDGMSLVPLIEGTATSWRTEILEHWGGGGTVQRGNPPDFWTIRTDQYRYVELITGEKELYDYSVDPYELTNKAGDPAYSAIQRDLASRLAALRAKAEANAVSPDNTSTASPPEEEK